MGTITARVRVLLATGAAALAGSGLWLLQAQEPPSEESQELRVNHAECALFGPQRDKYLESGLEAEKRRRFRLSQWSADIVGKLGTSQSKSSRNVSAPGTASTDSFQNLEGLGTIDSHLWRAMQEAGVVPAEKATSFEFARRVTLDLTGRVPTMIRLLQFASYDTPETRSRLIEELLASPEWVDRWTMYFGDMFQNTDRNSQVVRYAEGRNAFYRWIRDSLATNKPYNRMATELVASTGPNSYDAGELNWMVGGFMGGGPRTGQDIFDLQASKAAETFLGLGQLNCILCHDGRRHLDTISLWGRTATRYESWQLAAFFSRTALTRVVVTPGQQNSPYYWSVLDNTAFRTDYPLNTTTGNRPPRQPVGTVRNVPPVYPFTGRGPNPDENYRAALAREMTGDFLFAQAIVNYMWKEFFNKGLAEPANQLDPARLDPDNPPPEPWTLQAYHPRLLNDLARDFINSGYDLKALMRWIVSSETYQLSAKYNGAWNPAWENLFARKFVRRLWAEEVHDAIAQTSGILPRYTIRDTVKGAYTINWAMQLPEPRGLPDRAMGQFLDSFFRGNRDEEDRRSDGSTAQALNLMNDSFVMSRIRSTGTGATASLLARVLPYTDEQLVQALYLTVLSRYPTAEEKAAALANLASGVRTQKAEDLLWALYNKTDFFFNY